jgi:inorganic triphosphatase YgiF
MGGMRKRAVEGEVQAILTVKCSCYPEPWMSRNAARSVSVARPAKQYVFGRSHDAAMACERLIRSVAGMVIEPLEVELKLEIDPADAARFADAPALAGLNGEKTELLSTYFDTSDEDLRRKGYALRIRRKGDARIQTVKAEGEGAAGLFVRPEWEREVKGDRPVLDATAGPLAEVFPSDVLGSLAPMFETRVTRTIFEPTIAGAAIELALDVGEAVAGPRRTALCEVELELKSGSPRAIFDLARQLDAHVPLRLGMRSKSEAGYSLSRDDKPRAAKAEAVVLDRTGDTRDAFAAIAHNCIRQFRLNEGGVMTIGGAGSVHQARVGLRRLRSAFSLFKPLLAGDARADLLKLELKWLAAELGEVRNLDVLIPRMPEELHAQLGLARERALAHVRVALGSARTRLLMIDLAEWLAIGDWRVDPADPALAARLAPDFAADVLDRHRRRIKKRGKHLAALDDEHRHEVRIEGKKLRYAAEFFASLYSGKKARRRHKAFLSAIEDLQDALGELNDLVTGPDVLAALGIAQDLPVPSKRERRAMLDGAEESLETLLDVKRFWRT